MTTRSDLDRLAALALTHDLSAQESFIMSGNDLGMRRRRAVWRATHRGSKEMDFLLGRFAEQEVEDMSAAEIAVFERLVDVPDPTIEASVREGSSLGERDLDELIDRMRRFHRLTLPR